ncbi:MAG TPA: helicase-associated domain-containing protein [Ktedonobacterales bacterium]|nr:helicase-associated domain-containing protein [Ktedonobacterales bacterium]
MTTDDAPVVAAHLEHDLDAAIAFQRDLYLYWWAARELGELTLTSRGMVARATLRRLRTQWPVSDDDRAEGDDLRRYFLRRLLERLGLLRAITNPMEPSETKGRAEGRLIAADPAMMARFLAHPLAERLRICVRLWVAGGWWADGKPGDASTGPRSLHALLTPAQPRVALARRRLVETLAALEPGRPVETPGGASLAAFGPRIIGATAQTGRTARQRKPRDIAEERNQVMRAALMGPLRWLGLALRDEESASDAPGEVRLIVSRAALALRNEPDDAAIPETPGRVIIQPNLDALAYPPLTAPTLFTLDSCATRGALERVAHYHLTKSDVTRAHQQGWSDEELARRLEALTGQPLPGGVRVRLGDWARAADRIRLTPRATLLSTATPAVLDALLAARAAREWIVRRLGPTLALIPAEEIEAVRRWLLARGELPAIEQPDG